MKREALPQALLLVLLAATLLTAADLAIALLRMDSAAPPAPDAVILRSRTALPQSRVQTAQPPASAAGPEDARRPIHLAPAHQTSSTAAPEGFLTGESRLAQSARKLQPYVDRHSARFKISRSLIYAIIKAESNFDRLAVSPASAYGLMQLVPHTGGRDAYKMVYGSDEIPTREFLEDPDHNIELGTAYLSLLAKAFFAAVENPISREYCQIAAYNTGARNVFRAFANDYGPAIAMINSLSPDEVYDHLQNHLPYKETKVYLAKVLDYRRELAGI